VKTRVAHVTSVHGALDSRIYYRECRSLVRAGYDVTIVAPGAGDRTADGVRIKAVRQPKNRFQRMFVTAPAAVRVALRERAELYHLHDPELVPWGLALRMLGCRVVFDSHEDVPKDIELKTWIPRPLRRAASFAAAKFFQLTSRLLDATVVAVPSIAEGMGGRRVLTIYNYPVLEDLESMMLRPWSERSRAAIYFGSITEHRGLREMVSAMTIPDMPDGARLTLAGSFDDAAVFASAQTLPGWERTDFVGWQEGRALWELVGDAKVGLVTLHPTLTFPDGMPTKLFEYMALGLPVVASDFPAWRDIVSSCSCGILVNPLDPTAIGRAIAWLLRNPDDAAAMGERGRDAALRNYQWRTEATKLAALYADVCANVRIRRPERHVAAERPARSHRSA